MERDEGRPAGDTTNMTEGALADASADLQPVSGQHGAGAEGSSEHQDGRPETRGEGRGGRERGRRDRYGRERRPRSEDGESADASVPAAEARSGGSDTSEAAPGAMMPAAPSDEAVPARSSYFNVQPVAARDAGSATVTAPAAAPAAPATPAATARPEPAPIVVAAAAPAAAVAQPVAAPAAPFELKVDELASIAAGAGLQWVQSDAERVAQVKAAIAAEPQAARVPREPKPVAEIDEGPLVLVETRRDLRDMKLPFETTAK